MRKTTVLLIVILLNIQFIFAQEHVRIAVLPFGIDGDTQLSQTKKKEGWNKTLTNLFNQALIDISQNTNVDPYLRDKEKRIIKQLGFELNYSNFEYSETFNVFRGKLPYVQIVILGSYNPNPISTKDKQTVLTYKLVSMEETGYVLSGDVRIGMEIIDIDDPIFKKKFEENIKISLQKINSFQIFNILQQFEQLKILADEAIQKLDRIKTKDNSIQIDHVKFQIYEKIKDEKNKNLYADSLLRNSSTKNDIKLNIANTYYYLAHNRWWYSKEMKKAKGVFENLKSNKHNILEMNQLIDNSNRFIKKNRRNKWFSGISLGAGAIATTLFSISKYKHNIYRKNRLETNPIYENKSREEYKKEADNLIKWSRRTGILSASFFVAIPLNIWLYNKNK